MINVYTIAMKEFRDSVRNRWILTAAIAFAGLTIAISFIGSVPAGEIKGSPVHVVVASLASLTVYMLPLLALMIAHDAVVSEFERGTLMLLLTYPISRYEIFVGKFLGCLAVIAVVIPGGYAAACLGLLLNSGMYFHDLLAFVKLSASALLLSAVFISIGMVISILASERATAVGFTIGIWLLTVVVYDLALFGLLSLDSKNFVGPDVFSFLLMLNPADAFRTYNIAGIEGVSEVMGLSDLAESLHSKLFLFPAVMIFWLLGFATLGVHLLQRYKI